MFRQFLTSIQKLSASTEETTTWLFGILQVGILTCKDFFLVGSVQIEFHDYKLLDERKSADFQTEQAVDQVYR